MRKFLLGMLAGVVLACAAFGARDAFDAFHRLDQRVSYIEGYLGQLDQALRSGR